MKNFLDFFWDFITGGIFNYIGAIIRLPFSKEKFPVLLKDTLSNNIGMFATAIIFFVFLIYLKFSL
jgi:hypothetical protein